MVNDLEIDPDRPGTLYVATDVGVYVTSDLGGSWAALGTSFPNGVVSDMDLHSPTQTLTAATYGRSMFTYDLGATTTVADGAAAAALAPRLGPAAPNPTRGATRIAVELPRATPVSLAIYDAAGRLVRSIAQGSLPAGEHAFAWDGRNAQGRQVSGGVYLLKLDAGGVVRTGKLTVAP